MSVVVMVSCKLDRETGGVDPLSPRGVHSGIVSREVALSRFMHEDFGQLEAVRNVKLPRIALVKQHVHHHCV
jgi:hypothetical protein